MRILNPFIFLLNLFMYFAHLEKPSDGRYVFSKDIKYFRRR